MKKSLIYVGAASFTIALFTGCAALEDAAKDVQRRLEYQQTAENLGLNHEEAYREYLNKRDEYQKNNPELVIADDTILPYMAYLARSASLASQDLPYFERANIHAYNVDRELAGKKWDKCIKTGDEYIKNLQSKVERNKEALKKIQQRVAIVDEANANEKHMLSHMDWMSSKKELEAKIQEIQGENAKLEKHISLLQSKIAEANNEINKIKKAEEETVEKLKNPDFLYPKKDICSSSVPLWRDLKSGMNCLVLRKMKLIADSTFPALVESMPVIGGGYRADEEIGRITFVYAREAKIPANTGVLVGVRFAPKKSSEMADELIRKYTKELPDAVVTKKSVEADKQTYINCFTRYVIHHIVEFRDGAKVVKIVRCENKTEFTKSFQTLSPKTRQNILKSYAKDCGVEFSIDKFYNDSLSVLWVDIYDIQQMRAYNELYQKHVKNQETEKSKKRQEMLNF